MQTRGWKDDAERRDQDLANCAAAVDSGEPNPGTGWFSEVSLTARNGFGNDDEKGCYRHERNVCYSESVGWMWCLVGSRKRRVVESSTSCRFAGVEI
jgi:hypothetical protein